MTKRTTKAKPKVKREAEPVEEMPATNDSAEDIKNETDELLDEIDELLESEAEEFVKSYVQKGGE